MTKFAKFYPCEYF